MEQSNLQRLFCACDVNQSGKIELDDFTVVCRELNVADAEVQTLFGNFDTDDESCIDFGSFASRFHEVFQAQSVTASPPGMDFAVGFDAECALSERAEDMNGSRLLELEDGAQEQLAGTEERARAEERKKMEEVLRNVQRKHENQIADLRATAERLLQLPAKNEATARRTKPIRQSTLKHRSLESSMSTLSNVSLWADKYLDSGVSLAPDTTESSASDLDQDLDTDDGRGSTETIHRSYSCAHSDPELLDGKSEAGLSLAQSFGSMSSMRKQLSAFAKEKADPDEPDGALPMYHLVLAGDTGAGKSSFLMRLALNQFRADMQTTLGVDFQIKKMLVDGQKTNLQIWDTAGQERFRSIARSYFRKANGVLLFYDVTSESSFLNIRDWLDQIQDAAEDKVPVCIIGNKVDMREQLPAKRCVSTLEGEKLATAYGALFFETSAKDGTNVVEAVLHLAREVKKNVKAVKAMPKTSPVDLLATNAKKTFGTCCRL
ncbi:ras and EF-hand domain-containing protein isoform X6 [Syngnathus acus]|uniref:ras and EF-hand domain-containing protein isoform X6 n=1 Tax=Syngnathus acus TaxID=161584 RepID=UPI001885D99A|nr:ras and EF-hand domain-containing protein isoform X6 [Syngnathus acus]